MQATRFNFLWSAEVHYFCKAGCLRTFDLRLRVKAVLRHDQFHRSSRARSKFHIAISVVQQASWLMSDEDVSVEDTRYIWAGYVASVDSLGNCYSLGYARQEIYGRVLSICDISRTVCTSFAWKQVHVSCRYDKCDKIFNSVSQHRPANFGDSSIRLGIKWN